MKHIDNADYNYDKLREVSKDPFEQFSRWILEAKEETQDPRYNALVLSTAVNNKPSSRVVLLKKHSPEGFVIFTNYDSRKGREIEQNKNVALSFYWSPLEREIRIEGIIEKTSAEVSDELFYERPRASQIASNISKQSEKLESREILEEEFKKAGEKYRDENIPVPRPSHVGGYIIKPEKIQFWQGGNNRLNYRFLYEREGQNWKLSQLYP